MRSTVLLAELNNGLVGASTGYMEALRGDWTALVAQAASVSRRAVELSALSAGELPSLASYLQHHGAPTFEYVSLHGPAKDWTGSPELWVDVLEKLAPHVSGVVMHPDTLVEPHAFARLGSKLLIENMDPRKADGRTVEELSVYFAMLPDAGFCLDVAHVLLVDPSMALAHRMLDHFGSRLREVHVSSILEDGTHVPLTKDDLERFSGVLSRCQAVPWILEAAPGD